MRYGLKTEKVSGGKNPVGRAKPEQRECMVSQEMVLWSEWS